MTHLNIPCPLLQAMETKFVSDLSRIHRIRQILLVGEDQQECVPQFILVQHTLEFFTSFNDTFTIIRVNDEDDALSVLEVFGNDEPSTQSLSRMKHQQCLQRGRILSCPPTSQTVNEMFLYSTVSTLKPSEK